ncbi:hypothetical protein [Shewanella kaireitica]|uniref:hypothetical protein n=1 Tax=Shewanella kaireitica TaxID=212021 RepID=UPI00200C987B|nr:hypothetical protein [Shewanella kaireitica]MCL1092874.1 hypothetical protein [Shewanella kaireitica]
MQEQLPITILADSRFSSSLKPLLTQLEMWINFQALKADWFGDEACILSFEFTLVRTIEEQRLQAGAASEKGAEASSSKGAAAASGKEWRVEAGYAYSYDSKSLKTTAFIAVADLLEAGVGIEQGIKLRLVDVANSVGAEHGLALIAA